MGNLEIRLKEFVHSISPLKTTGADVSKEDIVCSLLLATSKGFETVITDMENMDTADLSMNLVR